jgi:hypothetical protein
MFLNCLILFVEKQAFLNPNGRIEDKKLVDGEYEKVKEEKYSLTLFNLMKKMMDVV